MSLKLWDFECPKCGSVFEDIVEMGVYKTRCLVCMDADADRIFTPSGCHTGNQDADWIRSVVDVVDKDDKSPHVQEFIRNPTRDNLNTWMKKEGLRHAEIGGSQHGEGYERRMAKQREEANHVGHMTDAVMKMRRRDRRIEI